MRSIGRLFGAVGTLTDGLLDLASVVSGITGDLRQQLTLDETPPLLPHGESIDGNADGGSSASVKRNNRTKAAA